MRSAISRAYYAAFLTARIKSNLTNEKNSRVHQLVSDYWYKTLPALADTLKDFRQRRNNADYELNMKFSSTDSERAIKTAEAIIKDLP